MPKVNIKNSIQKNLSIQKDPFLKEPLVKKPALKGKTQKKKTRAKRKSKKIKFSDFLPAMLLTAALILLSVVISVVILKVDSEKSVPAASAPLTDSARLEAQLPEAKLPAISTQAINTNEEKPSQTKPPEIKAPEARLPEETSVQIKAPEAKLTEVKAPQEKPAAAKPLEEKPIIAKPEIKEDAPAAPQRPVVSGTGAQTQAVSAKPEQKAIVPDKPAPAVAALVPDKTASSIAAVIPDKTDMSKPKKHLVFIIDDAGNNLNELKPFLQLPFSLTIAVLPGLPHSAEAARQIRAAGKEVFLHQPMEAIGGQNPGPGAIYSWMSAEEVQKILLANITEIGPVAGMNNHQGSKITTDRKIMEAVLDFCKSQGIYFLDSKTITDTVVPSVAGKLNIKIGERNIFIDNNQDRQSMNGYINKGLEFASRNGTSVLIGHTWSPELAPLLSDSNQNFIEQGYTFITASNYIKNLPSPR